MNQGDKALFACLFILCLSVHPEHKPLPCLVAAGMITGMTALFDRIGGSEMMENEKEEIGKEKSEGEAGEPPKNQQA